MAVSKIKAARIGSGVGYFVFGTIAFLIGGFASLGGGLSAIGTANFFTTLGAGLIAVGFWVSLFGKLEQRLIDLQEQIAGDGAVSVVESKQSDLAV